MKEPKNWPSKRIYSPESIGGDLHIEIIRQALFVPRLAHCVDPCIEEKRVHPHLEIREAVGPLRGRRDAQGFLECGLFANRAIAAGTLLGEFVGEIYLSSGEYNVSWAAFWGPLLVRVSGYRVANELMLSNDYRGLGPAPNLTTHWIVHRGVPHLGYVALRPIEADEEALIDYGAGWGRRYEEKFPLLAETESLPIYDS